MSWNNNRNETAFNSYISLERLLFKTVSTKFIHLFKNLKSPQNTKTLICRLNHDGGKGCENAYRSDILSDYIDLKLGVLSYIWL